MFHENYTGLILDMNFIQWWEVLLGATLRSYWAGDVASTPLKSFKAAGQDL